MTMMLVVGVGVIVLMGAGFTALWMVDARRNNRVASDPERDGRRGRWKRPSR